MRIIETLPQDIPYLERAVERAPVRVTPECLLVDVIALMSPPPSCALVNSEQASNESRSSAAPSSYVLVMEGSQLVGLFTERDVVRLTASGIDFAGVKIAEVMSQPAIALNQSQFQGIFTALSLFRQYQIRHLPLLDSQGELVGVITSESICQVLPSVNFLKARSVGEVMNTEVICAPATADTLSVACLMAEKQVSYVAIVAPDGGERRKPVGIITERDILQFQALELDLSQTRSETVMSTPLFRSRESDSLWVAYQEMQQRRVRRLVVCGSQGELLGIITQSTVLQAIEPSQMYKALDRLQRQVQRLEAEKIELLQNRNAKLEQLVQERTAQLQQQAECDRLLANMAQSMSQSININEILNTTVSEVRQFLQTDRVIIYRLNSDGSGVVLVESVDSQWISMLGKPIVDDNKAETYTQLYQQGHLQASVEDIYTAGLNQCHIDLLAQYQVRANLIVPILQKEKLWGLLVANHCASHREWRQLEIELLNRLSTQVAIAIQQASLFEQLQTELACRVQAEDAIRRLNAELEQRITERTQELLTANAQKDAEIAKRKQAEESRQKEQEFLKAVLDNVQAGIIACDAKGNLTIFNQTLRKFHNLPNQKLPAYQWTQFYDLYMADGKTPMSKKDVPLFRALQGERVENVELAIVPKKGVARTLLASGQAIYGLKGEKLGAVVVMHDITYRALADERLAKLNKCFLSFGTDPHENINRLTALCGELLKASFAFYNRLEGESLSGLAQWNAPNDRNWDADGEICYDIIGNGTGVMVGRNLPQSNTQWQTYVGHPVKCSGINVSCLCAVYQDDFVPSADDKKLLGIIASAIGVEEERKLAAEKIRHSQIFLDSIVENIPHMIFVKDANSLRFVRFNKAGVDLVGYCREEMIGKNDYELFASEEADFFIAKDREVLENRKMVDILEEPIQTRYHGTRILHTKKIPILDLEGNPQYLLGISEDITEHKQAQEALQQSKERFRNLVEHTNDLVWEINSNFVFTYVNPQIYKLLGYSPAEVLGKSLFDFMSEDEAQRLNTIFEYLTASKEPFTQVEKTLIHKDGERTVLFETSGLPLFSSEGVIQGYRGIDRDITSRKRVEMEMRKALTKEKELRELKSGFVTMASHEFRTPLTTILASAESLEHYRHKWSESKQLAYLQRIQSTVKKMIEMLNDVLILGKVEARKIEINPEPLDLEKFSQELVDEAQISNVEYRINCNVKGECRLAIVDEKLLRHILTNLLSNAIKYSPTGSNVHFTISCQDGVVVFQIQDEGIGITLEDQKRLFEPFHRGKNVGKIAGNGLGLAIVKKSVELHGGRIAVASVVGKGTLFTVTLPANKKGKEAI